MGCGSKKILNGDEKNPVQLSPKKKEKKQELTKQTKVLFHCEVCGKTSPNKLHTCSKTKPVSYQETRKAWCSNCNYNEQGICTLYKSLHPERDCVIETGIKIPEAACPASLWPKVLFKCKDCGSITFDENGVFACSICNSKEKRVCNLPWKFSAKDTALSASSDHCLIVFASTQQEVNILELTKARMQSYASKIGADFHIVYDNKEPRYSKANKFRLPTLTQNYKKTLLLSPFIIIKEDSPNIFKFMVTNAVRLSPFTTNLKFEQTEANILCEKQGISAVKITGYNDSVVVYPQQWSSIWNPPILPIRPTFLTTKLWLECNINAQKPLIVSLDERYNCVNDTRIQESYFVNGEKASHEESLSFINKVLYELNNQSL